jgi:hypothetical protein
VEIRLDEHEKRICAWLAKQRHASNRQAAVCNLQVGPQSNEMTELEGIGGEFAFCKLLNLYPDMSIKIGAGGADAKVGHLSVDVKTTTYLNGKLLAHVRKAEVACDIYVLVVGQMPTYRIAGWAYDLELLNERRLIDLGHGPVYAMTQSELRPMSELEAVAECYSSTMSVGDKGGTAP